MKKCIRCGETKEFTQFSKNKNTKDGYQVWCKSCKKEYSKQYCENNKEWKKQYDKQYYEQNKEHRKQYVKQHRQDNKEHYKQYSKQYRQENKEQVNSNNRKRRARKQAVMENYTSQDEQRTRNLFGHKCFNCNTTENLTIDHHKPLSKGYALDRYNAVLLCKSCNSSKWNKTPEEFYNEKDLELLDFMLNIVP